MQGALADKPMPGLPSGDSLIIGAHVLKVKNQGPMHVITPKVVANDHEASSSQVAVVQPRDPKYTQPKWCPCGIPKTQKRKLQRARNREKAEKEAEQSRDAIFNTKCLMVSSQVWVPRPIIMAASSAASLTPAISNDARSAITPDITYSSWADEVEAAELAMDEPADQGLVATEPAAKDPAISDGSMRGSGNLTDEDLLDYEESPARASMDINMVYYLPAEFHAAEEEGEIAQIDFGPKNAVFEKPQGPVKHLKPLYVRGHIDGKPVTMMMVDGGAVVNLMPYSVFKKLQLDDGDLMKTNMVLNGFEGGEGVEAKGIISLELTVGSKTLATAFFVAEVQGNYNVLLGRDWLHANQCVPSTMHQQLVQWVDNEVEVVQADDSACIALAESIVDW
jgi:hypothetical protein